MTAADNPFRTARLEALAYRPAVDLVERALVLRRSAIVGPMGTGKTTLLGELARGLRARGFEVVSAVVRRDEEGRPVRPSLPPAPGDRHAVLIDGLDLLPPWSRAAWWLRCRRAVVVLAGHRPLGCPVLHRTDADPGVLASLVAELAGSSAPPSPWLAERLEARGGNVREVLFELYDRASRGAVVAGVPRDTSAP